MFDLTINRRNMLIGSSALAGLSLAGLVRPGLVRAAPLQTVKYLTPFGYLIDFVETMYAETGGFFAKQGLDVEIEGGKGSSMAVQQVSAGNVLLSRTGGTDLIKAYLVNPAIVAVAEIYQRDIFYVISTQDKPIRTPADMAGKTIGIVSSRGATENILDMMLAAKDVPAADVKREVVGNAPAAFEFINQGRIAGYIATSDTVDQLKADHRPVFAWSTDDVAPVPGQVYMTSKKALAEQSDALVKFLRGVHECLGALLGMSDVAPVVASMLTKYDVVEAKRPDKGVAVLKTDIANYKPVYDAKLASRPESWIAAYDLMIKAGIVKPGDDRHFYDDSVRKAAFG
jgi:ABC-type nitrate/sulfonate/bicarbonate transport system substrate-binding protein